MLEGGVRECTAHSFCVLEKMRGSERRRVVRRIWYGVV